MLNRSLGWPDNHFAAIRPLSAINRWPVEEMGMNSVIPSMIPRMMTAIQSGIGCLDAKMRRLTSAKGTLFPFTLHPARSTLRHVFTRCHFLDRPGQSESGGRTDCGREEISGADSGHHPFSRGQNGAEPAAGGGPILSGRVERRLYRPAGPGRLSGPPAASGVRGEGF